MARRQRDERNGRVGLARWRLREGDSAVLAGRLPEAADLYAVAAYELDGLDPGDREVAALLAHALAGHGRVDLELGNADRALETLTNALEVVEPGSALCAAVLCCRACALRETGSVDEALRAFSDALAIQRVTDRTGEAVVGTLTELSRTLRSRGEPCAAERAAREAVEVAERVEPGGPAAGVGHHVLRQALDDLGRVGEAEVHLARGIDLLLRHVPGAAVTADAVERWCEVALSREGPNDALPCVDRQLAVIEPRVPGAPVVGVLRLWRGIALAALGSDEADAEAWREFTHAERLLAGHPDQAERTARARAERTTLLSRHRDQPHAG